MSEVNRTWMRRFGGILAFILLLGGACIGVAVGIAYLVKWNIWVGLGFVAVLVLGVLLFSTYPVRRGGGTDADA